MTLRQKVLFGLSWGFMLISFALAFAVFKAQAVSSVLFFLGGAFFGIGSAIAMQKESNGQDS